MAPTGESPFRAKLLNLSGFSDKPALAVNIELALIVLR
jgi:hypothetical protein